MVQDTKGTSECPVTQPQKYKARSMPQRGCDRMPHTANDQTTPPSVQMPSLICGSCYSQATDLH